MTEKVDFNGSIAIYAFRYCLGRRTYAVSDCVEYLMQHWSLIRPGWQELIQREIREAMDKGWAGDNCDINQWKKVLELEVNDD